MTATLATPVIDKVQAAMDSPTGKLKKFFQVSVVFDDADEPQVIVEGNYSARKAIDATREWANSVDRHATVRYFGKRVATTAIRTRKGEQVTVSIPAKDNPTAREVLMAQALNGGGFSITMPDAGFKVVGTFVGYTPAV